MFKEIVFGCGYEPVVEVDLSTEPGSVKRRLVSAPYPFKLPFNSLGTEDCRGDPGVRGMFQ